MAKKIVNKNGTKKADTIEITASNLTIKAGKGNDRITLTKGKNNTAYGEAGNDTITVNGGSSNLYGGAGNDVYVIGKNSTGTAKVKDFSVKKGNTDSVKITGGTVKSIGVSGSNVIVKGGKSAALTLQNAKNKTFTVTDTLGNYTVSGSNVKLTLGKNYKGTLTAASFITTVDAKSNANGITIKGNKKNNTIYGGAGNDTLYGGAGTDKLTGGKGRNTFVYANGDGKDTITDYTAGQDTLKISGGSIGKTALANSNKDLVFAVGSGTVTLTGAAAKAISLKDSRGSYTASNTEITLGSDFSGTMDATKYLSSVKTIDGSAAGKAVNITGNGQANVIKAGKAGGTINGGAGNDTLYGGAGSDKLTGGAGSDTFVYADGGGTDTITDYTAGQDTLQISGGSIGKTALANSNKDLVFTVGSGTVTLTDAATKAVSLKDSRGSYTASNTAITLGADFTGTMDATKYLSSVKTIDGSAATKAVNITGNGQANVIKAGKGGGTINGGAGNDTLYGGTGDDKLYGGAGDDTLYGGTGNDTINAGTGTNTLYFAKGDGTDIVISGGGSDTLVFSSETNKNNVTASYNGNNLNITYTGGTVILKDYKNGSHSVKYFKVGSTSNWPWTIASILPAPEPEYLKVGGYSIIQGTDAADNLTGTTGKDKLFGGKGNDTLNGGNGDDYLYGGAGDDSITGGAGSDWLFGGSGANKFFFSAGDGEDYINETAMDNTLVFKGLESLEDLSFSAVNRTWDGYYLDEDNERHDYYKYDLKISGYGDSNDSVLITSFFSTQNYDFSNLKLQAGENGETVTLYSMIKNDIETKCPADSSYPSGLKDIQTSYSQVRGLDNDQKYEGLDLTVSGYGHIYTGSGNDKIYLTTEGFELGDSEDSVSNVYSGAGNDLIDMTGLASRDEEKQWVSLDNTEGVNTIRCVVEKEVAGQTKHVLNSPIGIVLDYRIESGFAHSNTRAIEERWGDDKNEMSITAFKRDNDLILANNSLQGIYGGTIIIEDYYKLSEEEQAKISVGFYPTEPHFDDRYDPTVGYSMPDFLTYVLNNVDYIPVDKNYFGNDDVQNDSQINRYKTNWFNLVDNTVANEPTLVGDTEKANFIVGGANAVTINGGNSHDIIYAGDIEGYDENGDFIGSTKTTGVTINGGGGHDYIIGSAGNDKLNGTRGQNYINGGDGDDTLIGGDLSELDKNYGYYKYVNNELIGGKGDDTIWSVTADKSYQGGTTYFDNYMEGNEGNDTIYANGYRDTVYAGSGDDEIHSWKASGYSEGMIFGEEGNNRIYLYGDGFQRVEVGDGNNLIDTTQSTGRNGIVTGNGNNTINGGDGEDIITAGFGVNTINAGGGNDTVTVWGDGSVVDGGAGNDTITAYGTTTVNGGSGDDVIYINNGDHGSVSNLTVNGGDGNDIYITNAYGQSNYDTIVASEGKDVIKLTAYTGATAQKSGDDLVIIYNHKDVNYESSHTSSLTLKDYYKGGFENFFVQLYSDNYGRNLTNKFSVAEFINYANDGTDFYVTNGTDGDDRIKSANEINGKGGNDFILATAVDSQTINTGSGNNEVIAQAKQNEITGGTGDDYYNITGGHPADEGAGVSATITDAGGNNTIVIDRDYNGPASFNITLVGDGNNVIDGANVEDSKGLGVYTVSTGNGKQNIDVYSVNYNESNTLIETGSGEDSIRIWEGTVNAGAGNDTIAVWGDGGTLSGDTGDDTYISETSAYGNSVGSRIFINDNSGNNNMQLTSEDLTHDKIIFMMNVKSNGTVGNFMFDTDNNGTFDTEGNYNACVLGTGDLDNSGSKNAGYIWAAENVIKDSNKGYIRISSIDNMSRIETSDGYYLDTAAINKIKEDVAGWLSEKGYADVQTALSGEDQWTHPNFDTLTGPTYFGGLGWKPKSNLE